MGALLSTFPGDVPGVLRRGSPVVYADMFPAVVLLVQEIMPGVIGASIAIDHATLNLPDRCTDTRLVSLALDLTDKTGRAHLAWWCEDRAPGTTAHEPRGASPFMSIPERAAYSKAIAGSPMTPTQIDTLARLGLRLANRSAP